MTPMSMAGSLPVIALVARRFARRQGRRRRKPVNLPAVKVRIFTEPQFGATYEQQLRMAQAAEAAGFDGFFRSDHYLTMGGDGLPGPTDSWVTLAGLARETQRIRLGTLVTSSTFRLPGVLAIQVAQVDAMSGGRVELGLGAGWYDAEHAAYGIPFPALGERFERLEETYAILTGLWGTPADETFSYDGHHYHVTDSPALPKPVQRPRPPLIAGGGGPRRTPRLAATYADEYNLPFSSVADTEAQYALVRAACETRGRDPGTLRLSTAQTVCCGKDEAEVERRAANIGRTPDQLRAHGVAGTPDEVAARLRAFADIGAQTVYLQVLDLDDLDHLDLLAADVVPQVS
jgi:alkanesulfonate monooxygenase